MAYCTVTFTTDKAALSEQVSYYPWPNQVIDDALIDTVPVIASCSGNTYTAQLVQGAKYTIKANRFWFSNPEFIVPREGTAGLESLLQATRQG
jgi:hypothetical protein